MRVCERGITGCVVDHKTAAATLAACDRMNEKPLMLVEMGIQIAKAAIARAARERTTSCDAERYRHLVANCNVAYDPSEPWQLVISEPSTGEDWKAKLDAAIDAAIGAKNGGAA